MEIDKVIAVYCPKTRRLVIIERCEECPQFLEEKADTIICALKPEKMSKTVSIIVRKQKWKT